MMLLLAANYLKNKKRTKWKTKNILIIDLDVHQGRLGIQGINF